MSRDQSCGTRETIRGRGTVPGGGRMGTGIAGVAGVNPLASIFCGALINLKVP